jgi:hypothetical protein
LLRKLTLTIVLLLAVGAAIGQTAQASNNAPKSNYSIERQAVCYYFGSYCDQAMRVSSCETGGTYSVWATNGQYLGIFQMGSHERATYGHGNNVWAQAKAAYAYFVASGRDWSPWSCKP